MDLKHVEWLHKSIGSKNISMSPVKSFVFSEPVYVWAMRGSEFMLNYVS